jgi:hypothetical protein
MATKKKVADEASEPAVEVDTEAVDAKTDDAPAKVAESTPVDEPVESTELDPLSRVQGLLGVRVTGRMDHPTKMAIRKRQRAVGLPPSGQLDDRTRLHFRI